MKRYFISNNEKVFPEYFFVIYFPNGKVKRVYKYDECKDVIYRYPHAIRVEKYKNGTINISPERIDVYDNTR